MAGATVYMALRNCAHVEIPPFYLLYRFSVSEMKMKSEFEANHPIPDRQLI